MYHDELMKKLSLALLEGMIERGWPQMTGNVELDGKKYKVNLTVKEIK